MFLSVPPMPKVLRVFRLETHPRLARFVRTAGVAAAAASIATFTSDPGWELHEQEEDVLPVELSASASSWTDTFRGSGGGSGVQRMRFDGAIELTPSAPLATPVRVRLRFVPMDPAVEPIEETVFVTGSQVFTAVQHEITCMPEVTCSDEGSLTVDVLDTAELGSATLSLHWVSTASLYGRGPSVPADAHLAMTLP